MLVAVLVQQENLVFLDGEPDLVVDRYGKRLVAAAVEVTRRVDEFPGVYGVVDTLTLPLTNSRSLCTSSSLPSRQSLCLSDAGH